MFPTTLPARQTCVVLADGPDGELLEVARAVRQESPDVAIVVAADTQVLDQKGAGDRKASAQRAAVVAVIDALDGGIIEDL